MATINLIPNKRKLEKIHTSKRDNKIHSAVYNTDTWRKLRIQYLMLHPVCEECNKALAIDVHHKKEISTGSNESEYKQLGFDADNLQALCKDCHKSKHNNRSQW